MTPERFISFPQDAFASGQIGSKIWLCEQLEEHAGDKPLNIFVLAGWCGVLPFLLFSRTKMNISSVHLFDLDENSLAAARVINENWIWRDTRFFTHQMNINELSYTGNLVKPDVVINTSTEHISSTQWFQLVPASTLVALQSNNMAHHEHVACTQSIEEFSSKYPLSKTLFKGEKSFSYPEWAFTRFMHIGYK